jgi:hypothetical protein
MKPWQRVLHGVAAAAFAFLAGLVVFAVASAVSDLRETYLSHLVGFLPVFQIALCAICIWKRTSYVIILPGLALCGGLVAYLIHDDPQRPTLPDLGPVASTDSEGYKTYCWMVKDSPSSRVDEVQIEPSPSKTFIGETKEKWRDYLVANREAILRDWKNDQIGRDWIDALNQHPSAGVILCGSSGPSLNFHAVRAIADHRLAYVVWLATEGHGDEAMGLLIPFIRANYVLQRSGTALLNQMIPGVFIRRSYDAAAFLLDEDKLSVDSKKALVVALRESPPVEQILRNSILGQDYEFHDALDKIEESLSSGVDGSTHVKSSLVRFLQSIIYNPDLTERSFFEFNQDLFALLKTRDLDKMETLSDESERTHFDRWALKNPMGRMIKAIAVPAFNGVVKETWEEEDTRLALLKRLGAR